MDNEFLDIMKNTKDIGIQVSIDGSRPEIHDKIRDVKGSWEKATQAACQLAKIGKRVRICHVILPQNYQLIGEMIDLAVMLGCDIFATGLAVTTGRAFRNKQSVILTPSQIKFCKDIILKKTVEYQDTIRIIWAPDFTFWDMHLLLAPKFICLIRPEGQARLSCDLPFVVGDLRRQSLHEVWQDVKRAWQKKVVVNYITSWCRYQNNRRLPIAYYDPPIRV